MSTTLLLLPGMDGTGRLFEPFCSALPAGVEARVVRYPADHPLDLPQLAALVLRELPPQKPILVAESFSGLVALTLLSTAASRIGGIIFVGAFAEPPRPLLLRLTPLASGAAGLLRHAPAFLLRQYCLGNDASPEQLRLLRDTIASVSPQVFAQRIALAGARHAFRKAGAAVPCAYLRGKQDRLVPALCEHWFKERFPDLLREEIDGPHFLLQARPQESARAVVQLAERLGAGSRNS